MRLCLFCIVLMFFSCFGNSKEAVVNITKQNSLEVEHLTTSILQKAIITDSLWFHSWSWKIKNLIVDDFKFDWEKELNISWVEYNPNDPYLKSFDSLLIYSEAGLALDMYSSNTLIENHGNKIIVEFDVDAKVIITNQKEKRRSELISTGPYSIIEDCIWLDQDKIILLGYLDEIKQQNIPFLWIVDMKSSKQVFYRFEKSFPNHRKNFFLTKFTNASLRQE